MSASDAAPLPRLGEVFFDVRGSSRSMRLSWYADTGVAVFSIWQGGMCTGTFRLPIGDLPRMIEILQRGPHGDAQPAHDEADWRAREGYQDQRDYPPGGQRDPRLAAADRHPRRGDDLDETTAAGFGRDDLAERYGRDAIPADPREPEYGQGRPRRSGYYEDEHLADPRRPGYDYGDPLGEPRQPGYDQPARRDAPFMEDHGPEPGGASTGWDAFSDGPYPGYEAQMEPPSAGAPANWPESGEPSAGYGQERFVPPYMRAVGSEYPHDIPGSAADGPTLERRAAYRGGPPAGRSAAAGYPEPAWGPGGYSDSEQYRLTGAPPEQPDRWTEHQSPPRYGDAAPAEPEPGAYSARPLPADGSDGEAPDFRPRRAR